jgi:hypothetical protein
MEQLLKVCAIFARVGVGNPSTWVSIQIDTGLRKLI